MRRDELVELQYITPISNVPSMLIRGILSHERAAKVAHSSVALEEVQDRRRAKKVPGARWLHEYTNLYICARNPMLYRRLGEHQSLCVLRVSPSVLDLPGVVVTDGNAASSYVRFRAAPDGLSSVVRAQVFAEYWTHPDYIEKMRRAVAKCAEVLVPDRVAPEMILGAYVSGPEGLDSLAAVAPSIEVVVDRHLFFQ